MKLSSRKKEARLLWAKYEEIDADFWRIVKEHPEKDHNGNYIHPDVWEAYHGRNEAWCVWLSSTL